MTVRELSVFFPAYNEAGNIERTVTRAIDALDRHGFERYEIVVVDDGSKDETGAIADGIAARLPNVRVVHHPENRGYGAALRTGFETTTLEWVFFTDGDGQFDMGELDLLLARCDEAPLVIGYRERRADHFGRKVNTALWTGLVRMTFGLKVRDIDCAFKLIRRDVLRAVGPLDSSGALISTELLVRAKRLGISTVEVGVSHYPREAGEPTGASPRVIARALQELVRLRVRLAREGTGRNETVQ